MDDKIVMPGEQLSTSEELLPGEGTFEEDGIIRAARVGKYVVNKKYRRAEVEPITSVPVLLKRGDIVIAKLGIPIGKACIVPKDIDDGIIVADVVRVRVNQDENDIRFIEYVLNSEFVTRQLNKKIIGSTRPRVNLNHIRNLFLPIPELNEQKKIVTKLDEKMTQIEMMKKEAILVNVSRGPVIDEKALVKALEEKEIWGAGLDVYEREPEIEEKLLSLDNVVLLPHLGSATYETRLKMAMMAAKNLVQGLKGKKPDNLI